MSSKVGDLKKLEEKLEVKFDNNTLLKIAITHSSYAKEKNKSKYNERLEFLGDSVLQIVISEYLFTHYKNISEGELTKKRSLIVCENSLHNISKSWGLGHYILMSNGEESTGGRNRISILADCVEAILAAIYLDKGLEFVKIFILKNFMKTIQRAMDNKIILDYKTKLQESLQKNGTTNIIYNLIKSEGPPHRRKFYVSVQCEKDVKGKGIGYSKKDAEQASARNALKNMGEIYE